MVGTFPNTPAGWETLAATGPAEAPTLMVVAPTGGYELALIAWATQWGWRVSRPNPKHESFG